MSPVPPRWLVVGAGRCGLQLARSMILAGEPVVAVFARSKRGRARTRLAIPGLPLHGPGQPLPRVTRMLLAVPDDRLVDCATTLATLATAPLEVALHTSGLLPGSALAPLLKLGAALGSFHPLQSFPSGTGARVPLAGALAAIEGDPAARRVARALARSLGMVPHSVTATAKPRYHAAAAVAANLTHVLVVAAREQLLEAGFTPRAAVRALLPLVAAALGSALAAQGMERLTGPLARGDAGTVAAHLSVLPPALAEAYRALARYAIARLRTVQGARENELEAVAAALTRLG